MKKQLRYIAIILLIFFNKILLGQCPLTPIAIGGFVPNPTCQPVEVHLKSFSVNIAAGTDFIVDWDDGSPIETWTSPDGSNPFFDDVTPSNSDFYHVYTESGPDCYYSPSVIITNQPCGLSANLSSDINVWDTDEDGLAVTPTPNPAYLCEGQGDTFFFTDNTTWNCLTPPVGAPNNSNRTIYWEYGTGGDAINTDATITIDGNPSPYSPGGGAAAGAVAIAGSGTNSLSITIPPAATVGRVGQQYEITMYYWNTCNPFDDGVNPVPSEAPVVITSYIEIITTPPDLGGQNLNYCIGDPISINIVPSVGGTINWYADLADVGNMGAVISNATNFDPTNIPASPGDEINNSIAGSKTYYVTEMEGSTSCESAPSTVTVTVREDLTTNGPISCSKALNLCPGESGIIFSVPNDPPIQPFGGATEYVWTVPAGWNITAGQGTKSITVDIGPNSGLETVSVYLQYATDPRCPANTINFNKTVNDLPEANIGPANLYYCSSESANNPDIDITGITGETPLTIIYEWNAGANTQTLNNISADVNNDHPLPWPGAGTSTTYTLQSITDASGCVVTAPHANLTGSSIVEIWETLAVPGVPVGATDVCSNEQDVTYTLAIAPPTQPIGGDTRYRWREANTSDANTDWFDWDDGTTGFLDFETDDDQTIDVLTFGVVTTNRLRVRLEYQNTVTSGSRCETNYSHSDITIYPLPDVTLSGTTTICDGEAADLTFTVTDGPVNIEYTDGSSTFNLNNTNTVTVTTGALAATTTYTITSVERSVIPSCTGTFSGNAVITVNQLPTAAIIDADFTLCEGNDASFDIDLTGEAGGNYEITYQINGGGNIFTGLFNDNPFTLTIPAASLIVGAVNTITLINVTQDVGVATPCDGTIVPGSESIDITVDELPTSSDAGIDQQYCDPDVDATMTANLDVVGTGTWFLVSKPGVVPDPTIDNINLNTTDIHIVAGDWGEYEFEWVIANGVCPNSRDTILVDFGASPPAADAGPDDAECFPNYTLNGNDPTFGLGTWSKTSGPGNVSFDDENDMNAEVTVDAAGIYEFQWEITSGTCPASDAVVEIEFYALPTANDVAVTECSDATEGNSATLDLTVNEVTINGGVGITYSYFTDAILATAVPDETNHLITNGDIIYVLVHDGTCQDTAEISYTIDPTPTANNQTPTVCSDGTEGNTATVDLTSLNAAIDGGNGYTITYYTDAGLAPADEILTPTAYLVTNAEVIYAKVENGGCQDVATITYTVNPRPTAIDQTPAAICSDAPNGNQAVVNLTSLENSIDGGNGYTIDWFSDAALSLPIGSPNNYNATDGVAIYAQVLNGGCEDTATATYTINPTPNVTNADLNDEICTGDALNFIPTGDVAGTTFNWTSSVTDGAASGNTASSSGNITDVLVNNTDVDAEVTYVITPVAAGCTGAAENYVVTIHPKPNVSNTDLQDSICSGGSVLFTPTGDVAGTTFNWVSTESSGNVTDPGNGSGVISHALTNTGNVVENVTYTITPTANGCAGDTEDYVMYVNPRPVLGNTDLADSICSGEQLNFVPTGPVVGSVFNWTSSVTTGSVTGRTPNSSGPITDNLTNTALITSVVTYTITPVFNSCTGTSEDYEATVILYPDVNTAPTDAEICAGENTNFTINATGADLSYQWQIFSNPDYTDLANGGIYSNVTNSIMNLTNVDLSNNGNTYRILVTNEGLCIDSSHTANLTVNALPTITSHPDTSDICVNGDVSFDIAPNSPADFNYQWEVDDDGDDVFDVLPGETSAVLNISGITLAMDGYKYRCVLDSVSSGCSSISEIALLNVNPLPNITDHPDDITICERESTAFDMLPDDDLTYDYRWLVDRNDGNGFVTLAADANHTDVDMASLQIVDADISMNGFTYCCVITNTSSTCRDTTDAAVLTLKPLPVTSAISGRDNVCVGELAIAYQVTANPASTFTWLIPPEFTAAGGTINFGGGTNSPNHYVSLNYGMLPFVGDLHVVETNNGCTGDTVSLNIEAFENPAANAGNDTSICNGSDVLLGSSPTATGGSGTYVYQWTPTTYLDDATIANPTASPPISLTYSLKVLDASSGCESGIDPINITLNNVPAAPTSSDIAVCEGEAVPDLFAAGSNVKWYSDEFLSVLEYSGNSFTTGHTAVGDYDYWVTQTENGCESPSTPVILSINAIPTKITANDETICYGEPTPVLTASGGSNPQWYADAALTSLVNIGPTYNTGKFAVGVYTYYLTDKLNNCESEPDTVVLTINAIPAEPTSSDVTICQGETVPDLEAIGTNVQWYDDAGATSLVHTGNIFTSGQTAPGTYNYYATQTIDGCESNVKSVKLTINPSPVITNIQFTNQTACESNDGTITITANGTPPLSYSIDDEANFLANGSFSGLGTGTYPTAVKNYYGCVSRGDTINISAGGTPPSPDAGTDAFYCYGDAIADISATALSGGAIEWFSDPGLTNQIGTGNTFSPYNTIGETKYYASELAGGCYSLPTAVTITIYAIPAMPEVTDTAVCDGNPVPSLEAVGDNVKWYNDDALTLLAHIGNSYTTGNTAVGCYTYYVTQTVNNCESPANDATLVIHATPTAPAADDVTICYGEPTPDLTATGNNLTWYDDINLTNQVGTDSPFATGVTDVGVYPFYVTQTQGECESEEEEVLLTINAVPQKPVVLDTAICDDETVPNLTAQGQNVRWYDDTGLTNLVGSGNSFNTGHTDVGVYNYYVTQTINNCESAYETATLIINEKPDPPIAEDLEICFGEDAIVSALGYDIHWYSDDFGNPLVFTGNPYNTGETAEDDYNYYVTQVVNGCESETKEITLTINPVPLILNQSFQDQTACDSDDGEIEVIAKETPPEGEAPVEYSIDDGVTYQGSGIFTGLKNGLYPIVVSNGFGCITYGDTIEIIDGGAPPAPEAGDDSTYCEGTTLADLYAISSVGGNLTWYYDPVLTDIAGTGTNLTPKDTIAELTYYVTETSGACESSPTPVEVAIYPVPDKYDFLSDTSYCAGADGVPLQLDSSAYYIAYQLMKDDFAFGQEQFGNGVELTWEELLAGEYFVIGTDTATGCFAIMHDTVEVIENPLPDASFVMDTTQGCSPLTVHFNQIAEDPGTYIWNFDDGAIDSISEDPTHIFSNQTALVSYFEVYLKAITGSGCVDSSSQFVTVYPLPDYDFAIIPDSACHPANVQFSTKPGAASYKWNFGNGPQSGDYTMNYAFDNYTSTDKIFPVELIAVSSGFGCSDTVSKEVVVHPEPVADFELDAYNGCTPFTVHVTNNSSGNIARYFWDYGNNTGVDTTSAEEFDYTFYNSQTYEAVFDMKLTVESEEGCIAYASPRTIRVYPEVNANFIADTTGCSPLQVEFDNRSYGADIVSSWQFGDGQFSSSTNPVHEFINTGTTNQYFTVQLVVRSNQYFCTDTMERTVEVFPAPMAGFVFTPESPLLYPATTIYLTDETSEGSWDYSWDFGDGNTSTASDLYNYEYVYDTAGTYRISLHVSSENCWDTVSYLLEIHLPPPEIDISPSISGCSPLDVQFINNTIYASQFKWEFGDGSISYARSPEKTYYETGIYLVKLIATGPGGEVESNPLEIEVFKIPFADFGVSPILVYLPRGEVQTINRSDNADLYQWDFGNDSVSTAANPKILYQEEGVYDITLWAMTNTQPQCIDSITKQAAVTVEDPNDIKFMNAFMPGNVDGQAGDLNFAEFFPLIKKGGIEEFELQVFNRWGELVFESKDVNLGWNGRFMNTGRLMEQDVYVWKVYVKYDNGEYYHDAGDVTLLR